MRQLLGHKMRHIVKLEEQLESYYYENYFPSSNKDITYLESIGCHLLLSFKRSAEREFNIKLLLKGNCNLISKAIQRLHWKQRRKILILLRDSPDTRCYSLRVHSFFIYILSPLGRKWGHHIFLSSWIILLLLP